MSDESTVDKHPTRVSVWTAGGQVVLGNWNTRRVFAELSLPATVGLASSLASIAALEMTDTAPELSAALWIAYQQLHQAVAAWQLGECPAPRFWHPNPYPDPADWPPVPDGVTARCDNKSVGVLITDDQVRYLLIQRVRPPVGIAPVAGHIDQFGAADVAAIAEVAEEVGLTVTDLTPLTGRWRSNICRRQHGPWGPGHDWSIYHAEVTGTVTTDPAETTNPVWYTRQQLQQLAERTAAYAAGALPTDEWTAAPGIEPVWVDFLAELGIVDLPAADLAAVNRLASRSPYTPTD